MPRRSGDRNGVQTRVFGIRHHGPGSARSLRLALERFQPDAILIEGPADADPLVAYAAAEGMAPPVALLGYVPDSPSRAAFWPFAIFSPEWQALSYAAEHDVSVGFCDLPAANTLALDDAPGDRTDPLAALATAAGYDDPERWWDAIIESAADADVFDAITEAMAALREDAGEMDPTAEPDPAARTDPGSDDHRQPPDIALPATTDDPRTSHQPANAVADRNEPGPGTTATTANRSTTADHAALSGIRGTTEHGSLEDGASPHDAGTTPVDVETNHEPRSAAKREPGSTAPDTTAAAQDPGTAEQGPLKNITQQNNAQIAPGDNIEASRRRGPAARHESRSDTTAAPQDPGRAERGSLEDTAALHDAEITPWNDIEAGWRRGSAGRRKPGGTASDITAAPEDSGRAGRGSLEDAAALDDSDALARGDIGSPIDLHTLRREAYMRQTIRKAVKGGARRVAVVCGAWHAPALAGELGSAAADVRLLKGLPKVKVALTWVPWTHSRLAGASGYGAGVTSPGWYHHLFTETDRPIARWLTKVAATLRTHDLPVSSAHIIESVRLAETLAVLRGRPLPGLSEVTDATRAVLCEGDEAMLRLITGELVVGEALGSVPEDTPAVPLDADLRSRARTLRLPQQALTKQWDLDLRKERDVARSHLLHRLRLLGIGWGVPTSSEVRNTGTFRETWSLRWEPELAIAVIEASRWGTTIESAAEAKVLDTAADATVAGVSGALELALLADLGGAVDPLVSRLESVAALDHDVTNLLAALPGLVRTLRYGDVRGTDVNALARVADGLLIRICAGLPGAVTGLDADAAAALRALLDAAHLALATRDDEWATREWHGALRKLADRADVHGALVGRAVRLLCDVGVIDDAESARRLSVALSIGHSPTEKAAWIDGFLGGRGLLLVHDRNLLRRIDSWLRELHEDQFVATLPLLRRTFGAFESGERQAIAQAVRDGGPITTGASATADYDLALGTLALAAVTEILEVL
ncbi:DUF5682 family protein [Nocardia alni]|uniref:DUF5682 family protein n=1 Tax=Nocardia alni TaxID=2815723 RepID=UPI0020B1F60B|nr:DUF5682 family protein [Nocardia alni]